MANPIIMPKMGNSVESCIIVDWKKSVGDMVQQGETLCEVETDKAVMEVESTESGTLLALFFQVGDEVPVMTNIAAVGEAGERFDALDPHAAGGTADESGSPNGSVAAQAPSAAPASQVVEAATSSFRGQSDPTRFVSPRARKLAQRSGLDTTALVGTGPDGRVIERDVVAALATRPRLTPVAKAMVSSGGFEPPHAGTGPGGRVMSHDLVVKGGMSTVQPVEPGGLSDAAAAQQPSDDVKIIPVKGVRALIAQRMLASLQGTAQLTLNASADARALLELRKRFKASPDALGLQGVTINDLLLFAVSRTLPHFPELNALYADDTIRQHVSVHLGVAVDTVRGLMVPTIRDAATLSLRQLAVESRRLATACIEGRITPDELTGGTFTVTNLGAFGIESFTPVLNPPQVGILGVGTINLKPILIEDELEHVPHMGLSLTINHQVVDGAPAARFLQTVALNIAQIDLLLAV